MQALSDQSARLGVLEQTAAAISARLNELESQRAPSSFSSGSELNDLTVSGIPSTISDSPESVIKKVFVALGIEDMFGYVLSVRLMVGKSEAAVNPPRDENSMKTTQLTRLSYIVALSSRAVWDHVVNRRRAKRTLTVKDVLELDIAGNIFVSEFLPSKVYALLRQIKVKAVEMHCKLVWVWRGRVCVRKDSGQPIIHIDTIDDLSKLI